MQRTHLVIIDPQMDFCTPEGTYSGIRTGALLVNGADEDMRRLAKLVKRIASQVEQIHLTLDSHHLYDVAHPTFWKNQQGEHPSPFTIITAAEVRSGAWTTADPALRERMKAYVEALERGGRYPLMIWPPHCLIGTPGQCVVPELMEAVNGWAEARRGVVNFIHKGSNIYTEHYSAVRAEMPDPSDPSTQLNTRFIRTLEEADQVIWAGEAASHCVANTMRDTFAQMKPEGIRKMVLLTDATSAVTHCKGMYADFLKEMEKKGMRVSTTKDVV